MSNYPNSLPDYNTKKFTNLQTDCKEDSFNYWFAEILAIAVELGTLVKGDASNLKTRLAVALENDGVLKDYKKVNNEAGRLALTKSDGLLCWQKDNDSFWICDGTNWFQFATLADIETLLSSLYLDTFRVNISILPFLPGQTHVHYHIRITEENNPEPDEEDIVAEIETKDGSANCTYFDGTSFKSIPDEGIHYIHQGKILTWFVSDIETKPYYIFFRQYNVQTESYSQWQALGRGLLQIGPQGQPYDSGEFILQQNLIDATGYEFGVNITSAPVAIFTIPHACQLLEVTIGSKLNASENLVVTNLDFLKSSLDVFPPVDSICGGDLISYSVTDWQPGKNSAYKKTDLSSWLVNFNAGDFLICKGTVSALQNFFLTLKFKRV